MKKNVTAIYTKIVASIVTALMSIIGIAGVSSTAEAKIVDLTPNHMVPAYYIQVSTWSDQSEDYSVWVQKGAPIPSIETPIKKDYVFDGWWTQWTGGSPVTFPFTPTTDMTIHAHWKRANSGKVPVYRVFNPNNGKHHYTTNVEEKNNLVKSGWRDENIQFYGSTNTPGSVYAVYREYNPNNGNHNWTMSYGEHRSLISQGWRDEGIAWFVPKDGVTEVWRLYNPNNGEHLYTTNYDEYQSLGSAGWRREGQAWKAY